MSETYQEWVEGLEEGKNGCRRCISEGRDESADNFHYYGEGLGGNCFNCGYTLLSDEYKEEYGINEVELEEYDYMATEFNADLHNKIKEGTGTDSRDYRGVRTDISRSLGVRYEYSVEDGSVTKTLYPVTKGCLEKDIRESIVGYKVRSHPKGFNTPIGETGGECDLFMQWKFPTHKGMLLIVGGEHDALAAYQMLYDNHVRSGNSEKYDEIAVVSGTTGEGGVANQLRKQYQWLTQFSKIVICMDNDAAGEKAAQQVATVLPKGKAFSMPLRLKDANEYLEKGMEREFISDFWAARAHTPDNVHASTELYAAALEYATVKKLSLPPFLQKVSDMLGGGITTGEIFTVYGDTSVGKSLFTDSIVEHLIVNEPEHVLGIMSLEADKSKYATNLMARNLGVNLNKMEGQERVDYLKQPHIKEKLDKFLSKEGGTPRFYVYDNRGTGVDSIKESILEMVKSLGVTTVILDVISDITTSLSLSQQDEFVVWLKSLTLEFPYLTLIVVAHTRKRDTTEQILESDIIGSSILAKSSAQTLSLERNKLEEDDIKRNTTILTVQKNRHGQTTGIASRVYFNPVDATLNDLGEFKHSNPHMFMED